jgi:hypothetical protein
VNYTGLSEFMGELNEQVIPCIKPTKPNMDWYLVVPFLKGYECVRQINPHQITKLNG